MNDSPSTHNPMRIALVIERYDPAGGGAERSTAQIAEELARRGHHVTVIAGCIPDSVEPGAVELQPIGRGHLHGALKLAQFRQRAMRALAAGGFDTSLSVTPVVPAAVVQPRAGVIGELHRRSIAWRGSSAGRAVKRIALALNAKQQAMRAMERRTMASPMVQRVVAISRYMAEQLQRDYALPSERVELIPNAAAMPNLAGEEREQVRRRLREGFAIPEGATVFLFAAMDPRRKGFEPLLAATRRLADEERELVVLLAGAIEYPQHRAVADAGLSGHVRFVGPTQRMPALYAAADVTVLPTFYDPASKVVIESLMMGTPAISTVFNGASDQIQPEGGGQPRGRVIGDPADIAALAEAMAELMDPAERERCRAATAGLAEQLSMARHVDRLEAVLAATVGGEATTQPTPAPSPSGRGLG
ncbi:MAG: glycosyltransferase family 4 protein [Phycisphaeraceae bacterium]